MKQKLKLTRPLAVFDLETTGTAIGVDRIVEIAILKINPDGTEKPYRWRVNPEMPIPSESSAVHGIYDKDVEREPPFGEVAPRVAEILKGCDLAGYSILGFDLPLLKSEFKRVDVDFSPKGRHVIDPLRIFNRTEPHKLEDAYLFYCKSKHEAAHSASEDTRVCWEVMQAQLDRYADLPRNIEELHDYCQPPDDRYVDSDKKFEWRYGQAAFAFGPCRGLLLKDVATDNRSFLDWILRKDFSEETKRIVRDALEGKFPAR